jgi:hypothetical protein
MAKGQALKKTTAGKKKRRGQGPLPIVVAALICEKVLNEDAVISAIRIVDTLLMEPSQFDALTKQLQGEKDTIGIDPNLVMLITLRAGEVTEDKDVEIYAIGPSGKRALYGKGTFAFSTRPKGIGSISTSFPVKIKWEKLGTMWFEIVVDGQVIARPALDVKLKETQAQEASK